MGEPTGPRNSHGVKFSSDCWRTIRGVRWGNWMSCPGAEIIALYRAAGVRVRRFGEELYIHPDDHEKASAVDAANDHLFR